MFVDVTVVSIHTPTWGVTEVSRVKRWEAEVSIHTPTWGVTSTSLTRCCNSSFQSTHLHEVWLMFGSPKCWGDCVSIHTPTWGVTINTMLMVDVASVSIHTPTWGVTLILPSHEREPYVSIHTPTWGVTKASHCEHPIVVRFNPHTYMRCDRASLHFDMEAQVSIHTPTWGVTIITYSCRKISVCFNPHTYMRCDVGELLPVMWQYGFNPHTYMRCDWRTFRMSLRIFWFQSTHLHEVWPGKSSD